MPRRRSTSSTSTTTRRPARRSSASALAEPARRIAQNAGYEGAVIVAQIRTEGDGRGFNAATGEWVDMVKAGIIDPAKVTRSALQNAASIAAIVLTVESAVVEKPEDEEPAGRRPRPHALGRSASYPARGTAEAGSSDPASCVPHSE